MLPRAYKALWFAAMRYPMRLNAARHRVFSRRRGVVRAQLGPGPTNYLDGWVNVDANAMTAKIDIWADVGAKLPFRNESVDVFYSHHVIEHLRDRLLPFHFGELIRCLRPGGVVRIGGPNGDSAIVKFVQGDKAWFIDFPDSRESIGGRLANFIFCAGEHLTILTASYLTELATKAGFQDIRFCRPVEETNYPAVFAACLAMEWENDAEFPHTLIMEARKPA